MCLHLLNFFGNLYYSESTLPNTHTSRNDRKSSGKNNKLRFFIIIIQIKPILVDGA